jgi:small-conductance mechanosensitive channel
MLHTAIRICTVAVILVACALVPQRESFAQKEKTAPDREPLRKELEAKLKGQSPDDILAVLNQHANDWLTRKGAYELALQRLNAQATEASQLRERIADTKAPATAIPPVLRAADVEAAMKAAQAHAAFHTTRAEQLSKYKDSLAKIATLAIAFERTANAADEQLFKVKTVSAIAAKAGLADKLPEAANAKKLDEAATRLKTAITEAKQTADKAATELTKAVSDIHAAETAAIQAKVKLEELQKSQETLLATFKFAADAKAMTATQLAAELDKARKVLAEKLGAIAGDASDYKKAAATATEVRAKYDAVKDTFAARAPATGAKPEPATALERTERTLTDFRDQLAAHIRAIATREEHATQLIAALDELEKRATAYSTTLEDARRGALQIAAFASEVEQRFGRGDFEASKVPDTTPAATPALDTDANAVRDALNKLRDERDELRKPDAERDNLNLLLRTIHTRISERIDTLAEFKKLTTDYATARTNLPEAEQKRLDQRVADRLTSEAGQWDWALAIERSKASANATDLLASYYKELVDFEERAENLKRQKDLTDKLIESTRREADEVAKFRVVLEKHIANSAGAKEWDTAMQTRLSATGLKAETEAYQAEAARIASVVGANARRVEQLTGNAAADAKQPATAGRIGKAREELLQSRYRGLRTLGIKIGVVLLCALLIPGIVVFILRRAIRGGRDEAGNPSPVLAAFRRLLKAGVWIAATALILSILGYDVTALVVALAIGVLAVALAARPMILDVLGSIVIFAERRFKVGDVVRVGTNEAGRVIDLTWRSTSLKTPNGIVFSVPNRKVTETTIENLSRGGDTYDSVSVTVSTDKDAGKVINVIRTAVAQCKNVTADNGVTVLRYNQRGHIKVVEYRFWWFVKDYESRNKTRDEIFARIALGLAHEDMTGIEVTLG